ncbi:helix-turn-helix domain-containing protein [Cellulomonas rhizosphaerae]|uniref:Transcriptional regulator n=1 Tax=Cellulomonas rhizosphaerae TaxID=2293719 RepID=A0A413RJ21_9CELL|nr:helix-turn-helix domain-containing protein [Cellulomonas rhizosphaerae]RHA38418.1 transcriptional regulator [Cellulomonas rhizosphaerae]
MSATTVSAAHDEFVTTGHAPGRSVRRVVADSWRRSRRSGVDPEQSSPPVDVSANDLAGLRREHPLSVALPIVRQLLLDRDPGWVAALTDQTGRLLWVEGDARVRRQVEVAGFVAGAVWREDCAGTNAPGTALATNREVQVIGTEHWARPVQPWNCAAVPVHDSAGQVLGVLDVTGGSVVASGLAMQLVRATAAAIEATIASRPTGGTSAVPVGPPVPSLHVLGGQVGTLGLDAAAHRLGGRHAEILLLLAEHPAGLSGDQLAVLLSDAELSDVTVRAEVSRLRRLVGPLLSESRPYRLTRAVRTDVDVVRDALAVGDTTQALSAYTGPVLPRSVAPGVEKLRTRLADELRAAVLASRDPQLLARWAASDEGADDWAAWAALASSSVPGSAHHLRAHAQLVRLEREIGRRHPVG